SDIIAGVVGWVPLIDPEVGNDLSRLAAHPKFKGVRHVLQGEPDGYFLHDDFHRGLALLPDLDLRYDLLLFQRQLPVALQLVDRQPISASSSITSPSRKSAMEKSIPRGKPVWPSSPSATTSSA
ncbi:MAG: hypothetical protein RLZZ214_2258, partial [Verrucomicrobiota bacterium]